MGNTSKRVTNRLIVASVAILGALSVVWLAGFYIIERDIRFVAEATDMAALTVKQRALAAQCLKFAYEPARDDQEFRRIVEDFYHSHAELSRSTALDRDLRAKLQEADIPVLHMRSASQDIIGSSSAERAKGARSEIEAYYKDYVKSMEAADLRFSDLATQRLHASEHTRKALLLLSIGFVTLAGAIVAMPIRMRLRTAIIELEEAHLVESERAEELDGLRHELERANNELSDRHIKLRKAYDESTSNNQFLQLASARFEDLFHGVPFACFSVDNDGTVFEWNEAASTLFGVTGHESIQKSIYGRFFSVETDFMLKGLIAEAFKGNHLTNVEISTSGSGEPRRLLVSVFPLRAARQEPTAALIACADITRQKRAELDATKANQKVAAILDSIKDAFINLDRDLVFSYVNKTAAEWFGKSVDEIVGQPLLDVTPEIVGTDFVDRIHTVILTGQGSSFEYFFEKSGTWLEFRVYPSDEGVSVFYNDITARKQYDETIRRQQVQLEETMRQLSDTSVVLEHQSLELQEANRHLQELATTDGLTGLLNHRAMQDELRNAIEASMEAGAPVSVALLDVDHFKKFNDTFGHQEGDRVLKEVANILRSSVRDGDIVARYGGEEFCVIFPQTDGKEALVISERLRTNIESAAWQHRQVTVSVGTSTGIGVRDSQSLIKQADQALYQAKGAGRNRVLPFRPDSARCA